MIGPKFMTRFVRLARYTFKWIISGRDHSGIITEVMGQLHVRLADGTTGRTPRFQYLTCRGQE